MIGCVSGDFTGGDPKDMLDTIVVEQQRRIAHLEEEIRRARKSIMQLRGECNTSKEKASVKSLSEDVDTERSSKQPRYWTAEEHRRFLVASAKHGEKNYVVIAKDVGTRSAKQVRTHHQKYLKRLERESNKRARGQPTPEVEDLEDFVEENPTGMQKSQSMNKFLAELDSETMAGSSLSSIRDDDYWESPTILDGTSFSSSPSLNSCASELDYLGELDADAELFVDRIEVSEPLDHALV